MGSLFSAVWLGLMFTMTLGAEKGGGNTGLKKLGTFSISMFSIVMLFGSMLLCLGAAYDSRRAAALLIGGAFLTVVGWHRARHFEPGQAWLYLGRIGQPDLGRLGRVGSREQGPGLTPLEIQPSAGHYLVPAGGGGLRFLLGDTTLGGGLRVGSMLGLMALLMLGRENPMPRNSAPRIFAEVGTIMACGFIIVFQLLPTLRQLRLMRSLPISTIRLGLVAMAVMVLPLIAVGLAAAGIGWLASGAAMALMFLNCVAFFLAPAAFCVFFAVSFGEGIFGYVLLILTVFGAQRVYDWLQYSVYSMNVPLQLTATIGAGGVLVGWILTCWALALSSQAYRVRVNIAGAFPWGAGR
jgi:hypothetical protein